MAIDNPKQIMPAGANLAIRNSSGDLIFLMGGHVVMAPDYIRKCVEALLETGADCVGGKVESIGKGYIGNAIAIAMSSIFGVGNSQFRTTSSADHPLPTDTVSFCVYRRNVFEKIGYFNEKMIRHQDYEFNYRLRKAGGKILLLSSAVIKYCVRSTITGLWKQFWQYGVWKGRFVRKYPSSLKLRHLAPPVFVFLLVASVLLSFILKPILFAFIFAITAYSAFISIALIFLFLRQKISYLLALPVVLFSMHFGWGLGFWKGLFMKKLN
jgi:GT2 family glycosyltransferase